MLGHVRIQTSDFHDAPGAWCHEGWRQADFGFLWTWHVTIAEVTAVGSKWEGSTRTCGNLTLRARPQVRAL